MSTRPTRRTGLILTAALLGVLPVLAACGPPTATSPDADPTPAPGQPGRPLTVVATTNVWGSVAGAVAGPGVRVDSIVEDPAADPHSYESTPADTATIEDADLVVANGGGYDEWAEQAVQADPAVAGKTIKAFDLRADRAQDNEHVWFDPATVEAVVGQVVARLSALDPAQATALRDRAAAFTGALDGETTRLAAVGQARPGARVASTEPIAAYLFRAAGVADVTPAQFVEAIEEENDPPVASVAATQDLIASRGVGALVFNPQTETPVTVQVREGAQQAGVPAVAVTETLPAGMTYLQWLDGNRAALARALGAPA